MSDSLGKHISLAGTGHTVQGLKTLSGTEIFPELTDSFRLISCRFKRRMKFEYSHKILSETEIPFTVYDILQIPLRN